jgi:UDP-glucose 4-epimerase
VKLLVTGGAGFIGSHVAESFLRDGWTVDVVDDLSTGKRANVPSGARLHEVDVRSQEAGRLVERGAFDAIVHLAAQMDVRKSVMDPLFDSDVNIRGTINLMEALHRAHLRTRFVFASTGGGIYGDHAIPPNAENTRKEPDSPYGIAKLAVEHYLAYYARVHYLDTVTLRFANVYGPRQDPHGEAGVVAIFSNRILQGQPLTVYGDGTQTRDYIYISDVVGAVRAAVGVPLPEPLGIDARAFNVGTAIPTSVLQLASILRQVAGAQPPIEFAPNRRGEQLASFVTIDKAREHLGWAPQVGLEQGLRETFEWFAARAAALPAPMENTTTAAT